MQDLLKASIQPKLVSTAKALRLSGMNRKDFFAMVEKRKLRMRRDFSLSHFYVTELETALTEERTESKKRKIYIACMVIFSVCIGLYCFFG